MRLNALCMSHYSYQGDILQLPGTQKTACNASALWNHWSTVYGQWECRSHSLANKGNHGCWLDCHWALEDSMDRKDLFFLIQPWSICLYAGLVLAWNKVRGCWFTWLRLSMQLLHMCTHSIAKGCCLLVSFIRCVSSRQGRDYGSLPFTAIVC